MNELALLQTTWGIFMCEKLRKLRHCSRASMWVLRFLAVGICLTLTGRELKTRAGITGWETEHHLLRFHLKHKPSCMLALLCFRCVWRDFWLLFYNMRPVLVKSAYPQSLDTSLCFSVFVKDDQKQMFQYQWIKTCWREHQQTKIWFCSDFATPLSTLHDLYDGNKTNIYSSENSLHTITHVRKKFPNKLPGMCQRARQVQLLLSIKNVQNALSVPAGTLNKSWWVRLCGLVKLTHVEESWTVLSPLG